MSNVNLSKAKAGLILDQPFFASILLGLPMTEDSSVKTFATDGESIKYNPDFLNSLSLPEVVFVLAHETLHCVFQHMFRRGERNPNRWNQAADYVINDLLVNEKIGKMPKGGLLNPGLVSQGQGTTEGVYRLLPDSNDSKGPGDDGGAMDHVSDGGQDEAEMTQNQAEMKVKIIQAKTAAKMAGKLSGGIDRLVTELVKPKQDWKTVLRRFLSERAKIDLSYAKPKRRFLAEDIYLPSLIGERMGKIVVAVDCSGSINDSILDTFQTEIKSIHEDTKPSEIEIIYFDSKVVNTEKFGPDDTIELNPCGGGGTAFSPVFKYLDESEVAPIACVVLTDLECHDFGPAPEYPVLWAVTGSREARPFGDLIKLESEE